MEELKLLIEMVADLPAMALWVIGGYFLYKMLIVGSIYGTILYGANKVKEIVEVRQRAKVDAISEGKKTKTEDVLIGSMCITCDGTYQRVIRCLEQVKEHCNTCSGTYLHGQDATWLQSAIQEKIQSETNRSKENEN